jgi:hypothetical protein
MLHRERGSKGASLRPRLRLKQASDEAQRESSRQWGWAMAVLLSKVM